MYMDTTVKLCSIKNLLPDSEQIRSRIQARFHAPTKQPFDLLARIGMDCVGAIQLWPYETDIPSIQRVDAEPLTENEIEHLLQGYKDAPLGMQAEVDDFRISLAGAQEKTALLWWNNQWCRPRGSTPTSHIFKLPIGYIANNGIDLRESVENEWLCSKIAAEFGFPVADTRVAYFGQQKILIVERFDRRWAKDGQWLMRLPTEDFCQALGVAPALKYESDGGPGIARSMDLLLGSQQPLEDRILFFRSQIFFWMLAAIDGHAKNFSVFLEPNSAYRMALLYDVMSAYPLMHPKGIPPRKAKMARALSGRNRHFHWSTIMPRHFLSTAREVSFPVLQVEQLLAEMKQRTESVISKVETMLPAGFPEHISEAIFEGLRHQSARIP